MPRLRAGAVSQAGRKTALRAEMDRRGWNGGDLRRYLSEATGDAVGESTVYAWLADAGRSDSRPVPGWVLYLLRRV